jgi:hypothetical protein
MRPNRRFIPALAAVLALAAGPFPLAARAEGASPAQETSDLGEDGSRNATKRDREREGARPRAFAELSAGPLMGLDKPLRGASADALAGIRLSPFEAGLRAAGAYDGTLKTWDSRFDLIFGLGSGLRAIVGGLLVSGGRELSDSKGRKAEVYASPADWPNRFGIGAAIARLVPRVGGGNDGPELGLDAEFVYTSYRVKAEDALSGATAFVAGVELRAALRLRWGARAK